ncbi:MAG: phage tail sheath subtilisin-like domain-containing protein [Rhabdochlamydiaceae bacterium]
MAILLSPGIQAQEVDLTTTVPAVSTSTGALVGNFNWGPVMQVTQVTSPVGLASSFSKPDSNTANDFFTAYNYLSYSNDLQLVRVQTGGQLNAVGNDQAPLRIDGENQYFNDYYPTVQGDYNFGARYPGALGDSLTVYAWANGAAWTANSSNTNDPLYTWANYFQWAPGTSPYVKQVSNGATVNDEVHILVVDTQGLFTGQANTVLEKYQGLSVLSNALGVNGQSNYYKEIIWRQSSYVFVLGVPQANTTGWGTTITAAATSGIGHDANANVAVMTGGAVGSAVDGDYTNAYALFTNTENVDIDLVMCSAGDATVIDYVFENVSEKRTDCVAFASPSLTATQDNTSPAAAIVTFAQGTYYTSYGVFDSGWKYQYDQYNDVYRWVPLNGDIAGLCAYTDQVANPWWSPAGLQRGLIKNCIKLAFNPSQADRNTLYSAGVNPVVTFPGQGTMLYGDLTFLNYSSAFSHINVRRLFIVLEKTISQAAQAQLFQFNDATTQAQFVNLVTPFLRQVMGARGITNFQVVCNATNNTPAVVNANKFVGDIYVVPNYSINFITLHFVAVQNGVSFSSVVGAI